MTRSIEGTGALDQYWTMVYTGHIDKYLATDTSDKTRNMVVSNRGKFRIVSGLVARVLDKRSTLPYIPLEQLLETVLCYYRDLGHTKSRNLYEFLCAQMWWPKTLLYIDEILA